MSVNELLEQAHELKPSEKYMMIESLIQDLNHIDEDIEQAWIEESERRLQLYGEGKLETVSMEEVFADIKN
jgi:putative addiction module component (TIGR02574 family)